MKSEKTKIKKVKSIVRYRSQRIKGLYDPSSRKPFKISRSKLDKFIKCPRCFYMDRKLGIKQPDSLPYTLNSTVDTLLKKEFDIYRIAQQPHPICLENNIEVVPFKHKDIDRWRDSLHAGLQYIVPDTNIMLYGGIDDIWFDSKTQELIIVDYKATSKAGAVSLDADWQIVFKRQIEVYQWLLRKNGFAVSNVAYFVYCNGKSNVPRFDNCLKFDVSLLSYKGDDSWVENTVINAYQCLQSTIPTFTATCDYCSYLSAIQKHV